MARVLKEKTLLTKEEDTYTKPQNPAFFGCLSDLKSSHEPPTLKQKSLPPSEPTHLFLTRMVKRKGQTLLFFYKGLPSPAQPNKKGHPSYLKTGFSVEAIRREGEGRKGMPPFFLLLPRPFDHLFLYGLPITPNTPLSPRTKV